MNPVPFDPSHTRTTPEVRVCAPHAAAVTFAPKEVVDGRFRIVRLIGQGGMGQVFEAEDIELGTVVALKAIRPDLSRNQRSIERFKREVELARRVTHPNVCRIFDLSQHRSPSSWGCEDRPIFFLTMEIVRGETLARFLRREGPLSPERALPLIQEMADALDAAHRAGVVHRDFKSSNVLLAQGDAGPRVVVTDFGLAEPLTDDSLAPTGRFAGTPAYVAPEGGAGEEATTAADVYSFGVVIYEMLTGALPFSGPRPQDTARWRLTADPPPLRLRRPEIDRRWESTVLRCLKRRADRRFRHAGEALATLSAKTPSWRGPLKVLAAVLLAAVALALGRPGNGLETVRFPAPYANRDLGADPESSSISAAVDALASLGNETLRRARHDQGATWVVLSSALRPAPWDGRGPHGAVEASPMVADGGAALSGLPTSTEGSQLYAWGLERLRRFEFREARDLFSQAVATDPEAARVHLALAVTWASLGWDARAAEAALRAFELAKELPTRERLLIEGRYRETIRDWPRARQVYRKLWTRFADDPEYGLRLAAVETAGGDPLAALATVEELRRRARTTSGGPYLEARLDLTEAEAARARGLQERQRQAAARAAASGEALGAQLLLAEARLLEGEALHGLGRLDEGRAAIGQAREIYEAGGDRYRLAKALLNLAETLRHHRAKQAGLGLSYEEAFEISREIGDRRGSSRAFLHVALDEDDAARKTTLVEEALEKARQVGDHRAEAEALAFAAKMAIVRGDASRSVELFKQAAERAAQSGDLFLASGYLGNIAGLLVVSDPAHALAVAERAISDARRSGNLYAISMTLTKGGHVLSRTGNLGTAEERLREAIAGAHEIRSSKVLALASTDLGNIYVSQGEYSAAQSAFITAAGEWEKEGDPTAADGCRLLAIHAAALGGEDVEAALNELQPKYTNTSWQSQVAITRSEIFLRQGRLREVRETLDPILKSSWFPHQSAQARHSILSQVARIDLLEGRIERARRDLEALVVEAEETGSVPLRLGSQLLLGQALIAIGDEASARARLEPLLEEARGLGYDSIADQAIDALSSLG